MMTLFLFLFFTAFTYLLFRLFRSQRGYEESLQNIYALEIPTDPKIWEDVREHAWLMAQHPGVSPRGRLAFLDYVERLDMHRPFGAETYI